jgi:hypothetical protein
MVAPFRHPWLGFHAFTRKTGAAQQLAAHRQGVGIHWPDFKRSSQVRYLSHWQR